MIDSTTGQMDAETSSAADAGLILKATIDQPIRGECRCDSVPHSEHSSEPWLAIILLSVFFAFRRTKKRQFHANFELM